MSNPVLTLAIYIGFYVVFLHRQLAARGASSLVLVGRNCGVVCVITPLAHGIAQGKDLIFKIWAGLANPHVRA